MDAIFAAYHVSGAAAKSWRQRHFSPNRIIPPLRSIVVGVQAILRRSVSKIPMSENWCCLRQTCKSPGRPIVQQAHHSAAPLAGEALQFSTSPLAETMGADRFKIGGVEQ